MNLTFDHIVTTVSIIPILQKNESFYETFSQHNITNSTHNFVTIQAYIVNTIWISCSGNLILLHLFRYHNGDAFEMDSHLCGYTTTLTVW